MPTAYIFDSHGAYVFPLKTVGPIALFNYYNTVFRADISDP